jgi:hypothetical protein
VPGVVKLVEVDVLVRAIAGCCAAGTVTVDVAVTVCPEAATVPEAVPVLVTLPRSMSACVVV